MPSALDEPQPFGPPLPVRILKWLGRNAVTIAACAPAVLTAGVVATLAVAAGTSETGSLTAVYRREAERSVQAKNSKRAVMCLERLCSLGPAEPSYRFALVKSLAAEGDDRRAQALLTELAPLDRPGHAPAQVWKAAWLLQGGHVGPSQIQDAESHLSRALDTSPDDADAHLWLGQLYARTGRPEKAEPHLARVAPKNPGLFLLLAAVCDSLGKTASARNWTNDAVKEFRARTEATPADEASRLQWAGAVVRLGDHAAAARIIEQGLTRGDSPALRRGLGDVLAAWVDTVEKERPDALGERMALLDLGLRQCPNHPGLLQRLTRVLHTDGPESRQARARLESLLIDGQAAPTIHYLLGVEAHERGRVEEARVHFEQADRLAPGMPVVANNLAWFLVEGPNPEPERALKLIDAAVARHPNELPFRSTRGHVLVRMKRWKEALVDLEAALPLEAGLPDLHRDLAAAYDGLGLTDLAAAHRRRAAPSANSTPKGPPRTP